MTEPDPRWIVPASDVALRVRVRRFTHRFLFWSAFISLTSLSPQSSNAAEGRATPLQTLSAAPAKITNSTLAGLDGSMLARIYCASCHLFPDPNLLDKKTWKEQTLPRMKIRMGLAPTEIDKHPESKLLKATGLFPTVPMISEADWKSVADYYVATAPANALPQDPKPAIKMGLRLFEAERPKFKRPNPATTMVSISPKTHQIYIGDAQTKSLDILGSDGSLLKSIDVGNVPVSVVESDRGLYATLIGHFLPSEDPKGEFVFLEKTTSGFRAPKVILKDLPRATHAEFADLNGDGKLDFVISLFGNNVGRLSWFENKGTDSYEEHVLISKAGSLRTVIQDFNKDGSPDIAVLVAQELESLFLLYNDGKGNFTTQTVFQKPPSYGHSYFEVADFNNDGRPDFLVTNGDNGEYPSPLKKYHGIRIYLNKGNNQFEEAFFYPLNGAYKAVARDFDGDGDLDIAAISFFPDYDHMPQESFVYLENQGGLRFVAYTFPQYFTGRWLTMDAADIDGDGDVDIVLGSYIHGPSEVPQSLMDVWQKVGPSVLILRNKLH